MSIDLDGSLGVVAKCSAGESRWSRRSSAGRSGVLASGVSATKTPPGLVFRAAVLAKTSALKGCFNDVHTLRFHVRRIFLEAQVQADKCVLLVSEWMYLHELTEPSSQTGDFDVQFADTPSEGPRKERILRASQAQLPLRI